MQFGRPRLQGDSLVFATAKIVTVPSSRPIGGLSQAAHVRQYMRLIPFVSASREKLPLTVPVVLRYSPPPNREGVRRRHEDRGRHARCARYLCGVPAHSDGNNQVLPLCAIRAWCSRPSPRPLKLTLKIFPARRWCILRCGWCWRCSHTRKHRHTREYESARVQGRAEPGSGPVSC